MLQPKILTQLQALPIAKPVMQNDNVMVQNTIPKMPNEMMLRTKADVVRLETGIASETSLLDDVFVVSVSESLKKSSAYRGVQGPS